MTTHEFCETAGEDRVVRVAIPVDAAGQSYRVLVQVEPIQAVDDPDWPEGFFEGTAGKWIGELQRAPQGAYPIRATL
ncbi:MAG: hypothetical protein SFU86_10140 [Pirellulaceae bacterium]|nr:hypothetical protein [Pirellulaceae bacterium]